MTRASRLGPFLPAILPLLQSSTPVWASRSVFASTSILPSLGSFNQFSNFSSSAIMSTSGTMIESQAQRLQNAFSPSALEAVREFWFRDLKEEDLVLPPMQVAMRWFQRNEEFDQACLANFGEQLELMQSTDVTVAEILKVAQPSSPLDWLSLVLLLDQFPRNVFRDDKARIVFTVTDPKALELALQAVEVGIPEQSQIRFRLGYRFWFYLPLEHSEDPRMQVMCLEAHKKMVSEIGGLAAESESDLHDDDTRKCHAILSANKQTVDGWAGQLMKVVHQHKDLIDKFGRYPHRNEALGREPTAEETKYLAEGGETFGGGKKVESE
ncbi:hypothetical protein B0H66DRAFT_297218 [Apodospora peruviana]|uniref:Transmembrane protein n=1 Tax=Apodospora peruviana TaxID=516989 RepID=A0AAE0I127_9PEZI|nr:hypothetical protein B0H66DRAFT_297218 [Apodospora peruviana]